jgi:hypothetical protein
MLTDDGGDDGVWPLLHGLNNSHRRRFVYSPRPVATPPPMVQQGRAATTIVDAFGASQAKT